LAGAGAFCLYLWTVHTAYVKERDPQFSGNWTTFSEGCIDCPADENPVIIKLNLDVTEGDVHGEIYIDDPFSEGKPNSKKTSDELARELAKSYTHYFMVEGQLSFYGGTIWLFDYRMGKKAYFAKADIKLRNGALYFESKKRAYETIPQRAVFSSAIEESAEDIAEKK